MIIHVDNFDGDDRHRHPSNPDTPLRSADAAFRQLGTNWTDQAEIRFKANTGRPYIMSTSTLYLGHPVGTNASSLVLRAGFPGESAYTNVLGDVRAAPSSGDFVVATTSRALEVDELVGAVLTRRTRLSPTGSEIGTAISIRGNTGGVNPTIFLQRTIGTVASGDIFWVEKPSVTLQWPAPGSTGPTPALNLISSDGRSLNLTMIGIKLSLGPGTGLNLSGVRAQCDTCEIAFTGGVGFVHINSRIQGGIADANVAPDPSDLLVPVRKSLRAQAGVFIYNNDQSRIIAAARGGVLGGHLTFRQITVQVSQDGTFVPKSLEALQAPIHILAGGLALGEREEGRPAGWGTADNKARIRNVTGLQSDGLRVFNGGSVQGGAGSLHLDISGCGRDGVRLDMGSTASFGPAGEGAGLVSTTENGGFGMNIRNGSRALVGSDAPVKPLSGRSGEVALEDERLLGGWGRVVSGPALPVSPQQSGVFVSR